MFSAEEGVLRAAAGGEVTTRADQVEGQAHPAARGRGSTPEGGVVWAGGEQLLTYLPSLHLPPLNRSSTPAGGVVWAGGEQLLTYLPSLHLPPLTQSMAPTRRIVWARGEQLLTTAVTSLDPNVFLC